MKGITPAYIYLNPPFVSAEFLKSLKLIVPLNLNNIYLLNDKCVSLNYNLVFKVNNA